MPAPLPTITVALAVRFNVEPFPIVRAEFSVILAALFADTNKLDPVKYKDDALSVIVDDSTSNGTYSPTRTSRITTEFKVKVFASTKNPSPKPLNPGMLLNVIIPEDPIVRTAPSVTISAANAPNVTVLLLVIKRPVFFVRVMVASLIIKFDSLRSSVELSVIVTIDADSVVLRYAKFIEAMLRSNTRSSIDNDVPRRLNDDVLSYSTIPLLFPKIRPAFLVRVMSDPSNKA